MGSSKSQQQTSMQDNRRVLGEGSISAEGSTVTVLDNGAINRAFDFGDNALSSTGDIVKKALQFGLDSQAASSAAMAKSTSVLTDAYNNAKGRGALTDYITIGAIAMAGIVAFYAVKK